VQGGVALDLVHRELVLFSHELVVASGYAVRPRQEDLPARGAAHLLFCEPGDHLLSSGLEDAQGSSDLGDDGAEAAAGDLELLPGRER
jgi:hypothetical protein